MDFCFLQTVYCTLIALAYTLIALAPLNSTEKMRRLHNAFESHLELIPGLRACCYASRILHKIKPIADVYIYVYLAVASKL